MSHYESSIMGNPAAKEGDKVVGVDTHIVMIPSPAGPIPTPTPMPFNGLPSGALYAVAACVLARVGAAAHRSALIALHGDGPERATVAMDLPEPGGPFVASVGQAQVRQLARPKGRPEAGELAQLERLARGCLEDIGSMGVLLAPETVGDDADPRPFAQRMLESYDALCALGVASPGVPAHPDLLGQARRWAGEVPDKARRIALSFVLAHLAVGA